MIIHPSGVAEVHASAFVERSTAPPRSPSPPGVAEVHASAFVERSTARTDSSGTSSVAEVHASAFVERWFPLNRTPGKCPSVAEVHASAFVERASTFLAIPPRHGVSPRFTPRPSLSGAHARSLKRPVASVAEVHASAFVERGPPRTSLRGWTGVAEVHASAFVERTMQLSSHGGNAKCRRGSRLGLR